MLQSENEDMITMKSEERKTRFGSVLVLVQMLCIICFSKVSFFLVNS